MYFVIATELIVAVWNDLYRNFSIAIYGSYKFLFQKYDLENYVNVFWST